ncbi:DUF4917 family protein [Vibrio sp. TRT 21S02]|uniref:DUF4917 family protein n=1 Tax=Vibrio TaxID=662 RepID=UPI00215BF600|nr:DUF4917 family protein [Vibrio parahaemolyticus]MCR9663887.1 DUF4917 family protein [Vibrio parahaemolyticus]MCR9679341.1 DUF4917 family protein [Vibrio parahaemolyticus]
MSYEINNWSDLEGRYNHSILLGNGASISINRSFSYASLKEHAIEHGLLSEEVEKLFEHFETDDFELILRLVWQANKVNAALSIKDKATKKAYEHVRQCLIEAVRSIHPEYSEVEDDLDAIGSFLSRFKTVLSLNYDLTLYWVIMKSNRADDGHRFKDCFISGEFDEDWSRFRESLNRRDRRTTLVFYPHGNLALARNVVEEEVKLDSRSSIDLLRSILSKWETGNYIPLFVSEGVTTQKVRAIQNSHYLYTTYREVLPDLGKSLVIYGWGLGEHDVHIIERIKVSKVKRIAVSVYGNDQAYCRRVSEIILDTFGRDFEIDFFDSQSSGCWNNDA